MMNKLLSQTRLAAAAIALALGSIPIIAEEITPGTVLDASSIDQLTDKTFEGHRISDLLPAGTELQIREYGLEMILQPAELVVPRPEVVAMTELHKGEATLDDQKRLANHTSGIPFPDLSTDDPDAGYKLAYNMLRTGWLGDTLDLNPMYFLVIDGKKGLQREQGWRFKRYLVSGRIAEPHSEDPEIVKYESLINLYPQDTRGVGILTVNYTDARLADVYAYIKSLRRVRRLSSGSWADPISGTDLLTDETFAINLDPTWYDNWELQGKRFILATRDSTIKPLNLDSKDPKTRFASMQLDKAPYWNYVDNYAPTEVWMLKGTPPKSHLNSSRLMFVGTDPNAPLFYGVEYYDKKGELWRRTRISFANGVWDDGQPGPFITMVSVVDLQRLHATVLYQGKDWRYNPPADASDFTPEALPRQLK
ncbi:MAG: hypothetical protein DRQ60_10925 [Gammaproteobacteria bacterium]|nr:MAG: hypothetical protein DRQ54_07050 [Gammaproteobacteria bacterium]RLA10671.1 MAG: hypothetical protein DRQ60_10925 [Gammaproteobacteria bacterium]RLA12163.1 MAG: hypothetical protein DRQ52_08420 [Gammaproteobacteria bacterium]